MLEFAKKYIEKKWTLPVLKNVYLQATTEWLRLRTTDMYKDFSAILKDIKVIEEWAITVNVNQLYNLLKRDKSYMLELSTEDSNLLISWDTIKSTIYGITGKEYIVEIKRPECIIPCSTSLLLEAIEKVSYVITPKSFSPSLTGMLIKQIADQTNFVGTDSFRLVRYRAQADLWEFECIVPVDTLTTLIPVLKYAVSIGATRLTIGKNNNMFSLQLSVGDQEITISCILLQGNYPDYDREEVIPTSYQGYLTVDRQELLQKLPQIMALTGAQMNFPVKFSVADDQLTLSSGNTDKGKLSSTLSCHCFGGFEDFSVNGSFLLDFLKKCSSPQVKIEVINNKKPLRITGVNDSNVEYIVRPLVG